jgi:hypothetical protein
VFLPKNRKKLMHTPGIKIVFICAIIYSQIAGWQVKNKQERIWKETVIAQSRYYSSTFLEGLRKTTKTPVMISGVPAQI